MQQILVDMNYYGSQAASGMRVPKPRMTTTFVMDKLCPVLDVYASPDLLISGKWLTAIQSKIYVVKMNDGMRGYHHRYRNTKGGCRSLGEFWCRVSYIADRHDL